MNKRSNIDNPLKVEVSSELFNSILNSRRKNRNWPQHVCARPNENQVLVRVEISVLMDWDNHDPDDEYSYDVQNHENVTDDCFFFLGEYEFENNESIIRSLRSWEEELYETVIRLNDDFLEDEWNKRYPQYYYEAIDFDCYVLFENEDAPKAAPRLWNQLALFQ